MKISYAVTVCNELVELEKLLPFLVSNKRAEDEVVVLYDSTNGSERVDEYLRAKSVDNPGFRWHSYPFNGDFSQMKNHLTELCTGDYIYQIDADEMIDEYVMRLLPQVLEINDVEVLRVPRINTVEGLTESHTQKWRWQVNDKGYVNFPDYQWRIYKNNAGITWVNKVHEVLTGYKTVAVLPAEEEWCLIHHKDIKRQEKQNEYYAQL